MSVDRKTCLGVFAKIIGQCWLALLGLTFSLLPAASQAADGWSALPQPGMAVRTLGAEPSALALAKQARVLAVALNESGDDEDDEDDDDDGTRTVGLAWLNPDTGAEIGRMNLASMPVAIALNATGDMAYLLLERSTEVHVVNLTTKAIVRKWNAGTQPRALSLSADGQELVVADSDQKKLYAYDPATGALVRTMVLDVMPLQLTHGQQSGSNARLLVAASGGLLITFDASTWFEVSRVKIGDDIRALDMWDGGGMALAVGIRQDALNVINPTNGVITNRIAINGDPDRLATDNLANRAYVTTKNDLSVNRVDLNSGSLQGRYAIPESPGGVVFDSQAKVLYLSQAGAQRILRLDPEQASLVNALDLTRRLRDLAANNTTHELAAIADGASELVRINLLTKNGQSIQLPSVPLRISVDPVLNRAVVGMTKDGRNEIAFVDLAAATPTLYTERINVQEQVVALAVDPTRKRTVVVSGEGRLTSINNESRTRIATVTKDQDYVDVAIHAGTGKAYLLTDEGIVQQIDPATLAIEKTWDLDVEAEHLAVDDKRNIVLISSSEGSKVIRFDIATGKITNSFKFPESPRQIASHPENALAVILSKESNKLGILDVAANAANGGFATVERPLRAAISTRFNQAYVVSAVSDDLQIIQLPNPAPVLTKLSPTQANAGSEALTLTVEGSQFIDGSLVMANDTALATKWISSQKLEAALPASLLANASTLVMKVKTNGPGGGVSSGINFEVVSASPVLNGFDPGQLLANGQVQNLVLLGQNFKPGASVQAGSQTLTPIAVTTTQISLQVPGTLLAQAGALSLSVKNPDGAASGVLDLPIAAVSLGPVINGIDPLLGPVGTTVTITGSSFATSAQDNQVSFAADASNAASRVNAPIISASSTQLVVTVPPNAVTGTVAVSTPNGTATGPVFTVKDAVDVSFTANPANTTVYQGANTNISLALADVGIKEYTGLMQLSVTGMPDGVTAKLTPQYLSRGQNGTLVLTASNSAVITDAPVLVTITATDTAGLGIIRKATFRVNVAASAGVSGVKGRFVTPEGAGIGGVRVAYQDANGNLVSQVQSDPSGAFVLTGLPAGTVTLRMDSTPVNPVYPIWPYTMNNPGDGLVSLPDWVINPPPADAKFVAISNTTQDQAITDERFPGLEIKLPAGVTITGWDGVKKTRIAVERITPDKLPVTTPPFPMKEAYQLYFGTPMGGIPSAPIPITLPNVAEAEPGDKLDIWFFEGSPMGGTGEWKIAGKGVVSADGKTVSTLPGEGITRFCGVCGLFSLSCPPVDKPPPCNTCPPKGPTGGNPVDLLTGQEAPKNVGLSLAGINNVSVSMSYNPVDAFNGRAGTFASFGLGWTLNYDIVMTPNGTQARLFMPGGIFVDFQNTGNNVYKVIKEQAFDGAEISPINLASNLWQLKHRDGRIWKFGPFPGITGVIRGGPPLFVTEMVDAQGNSIHITRQSNGRINAVGSNARNISFTYGANGFVSSIKDTADRSMQFTYNTKNRIETVTDADNKVTKYTYVDDNEIPTDPVCGTQATMGERIKTITYPGKPNPTENFYGVAKRVLRQIAADGRETKFSYKLTGACVTHISKPGVQCTDATCPTEDNWENFQAGWRIHGGQVFSTTVTNPNGTSETWRFASDNTPVEHIDAMGQQTLYKYDSFKRKIEEKDPLGRVTKYQYDANGNQSVIIDPLQRVTRMAYDPKWNTVTTITRYNDPTPLGQANPQTRIMQYDSATGVLKKSTSPLNNVTTFDYTAQGLLKKITTAGGSVTEIEYTPEGDLQKIIDPMKREGQFKYDAAGRTVTVTDARGHSTHTQYNGVDQIIEVTDALEGKTKYTFDGAQRLATVVNPLNNTIQTNTYDDGDRLKTQANALNQALSNEYDSAGRLIKTTNAKGAVTTFSYDNTGRLATIIRPEGTQTLSYDLVGRLIHIAEADATLEYEYDAVNRITRHTQRIGARVSTLDYAYDALNRLVRRTLTSTDSSGATLAPDTTEYQYDNGDRLTQIVYKGVDGKNDITAYTWDADNRLTQKTLPNGIEVSYQYDLASQLKQVEYMTSTGAVIDRIQYAYDANGQIIQRDSLNAIGKDETPYTAIYDAANRLTQITLNPGTANQASYTLTYDANGNLVQKQNSSNVSETTTYQWDSRNRLIALNSPGVLAHFQYDATGRRVSKTVNGQTTTYIYDGMQAIGEIQPGAAGSEVRINLTGLNIDEAIAKYTQTQNSSGTSAQISSTYLTDILGSVIAQAKADQTIENRYGYSPYGEVAAQNISNGNAVQYTARENDDTGLYYYRARYYDPVLKRFVSSDPLGLAGGMNTYSYVQGNPLSYIDPTGELVFVPAVYYGGLALMTAAAAYYGVQGTLNAMQNSSSSSSSKPARTPAEEQQAQAEHDWYKSVCDNKKPPSGDKCQDILNEANRAWNCARLMSDWDDKWAPGRHGGDIARWSQRYRRLMKEYEECKKDCP